MYECPVCQSMMEEETVMVTECCGTEVNVDDSDEALEECPGCGQPEPEIVEGPTRLVCENCCYTE